MKVIGLDEIKKAVEYTPNKYSVFTRPSVARKRDCAYCLHCIGRASSGEYVCQQQVCPAVVTGYDKRNVA